MPRVKKLQPHVITCTYFTFISYFLFPFTFFFLIIFLIFSTLCFISFSNLSPFHSYGRPPPHLLSKWSTLPSFLLYYLRHLSSKLFATPEPRFHLFIPLLSLSEIIWHLWSSNYIMLYFDFLTLMFLFCSSLTLSIISSSTVCHSSLLFSNNLTDTFLLVPRSPLPFLKSSLLFVSLIHSSNIFISVLPLFLFSNFISLPCFYPQFIPFWLF